MAGEPREIDPDAVHIFDVEKALGEMSGPTGRWDMATSPNSYIAVFQTPPRGGETHIHSHPDSDQILYVLRGQCTVEGLSGKYMLDANQGVLIPAGVNYGFTNETAEPLVFLSIRTEATGGRRVAFVPNDPSGIFVKIPEDELVAEGIGRNVFVYALDRRTIGVSPLLFEDWNKGSLLRMNCTYERKEGYIVANLPTRFTRWYRLDQLSEGDYNLELDPKRTRVKVDLSPLIREELG